jgi:uncharacterized protein YndB with AHSA1/START domain
MSGVRPRKVAARKSTARQGGPLRLVVRRTIRAPAARLFSAFTEPAQLVKWWGPPPAHCPFAEVDLRVGGKYRIANAFPDGTLVYIAGEFERIAPPRELVYSWRLEGSAGPEERVHICFEEIGPTTTVVVTHERISSAKARKRHALGWEGCLDGLARYAAG